MHLFTCIHANVVKNVFLSFNFRAEWAPVCANRSRSNIKSNEPLNFSVEASLRERKKLYHVF